VSALPELERHLSVKDIAQALAVSEKSVHRAIDRGELTAVQIGRAVRVPESSYHAWLERLRRRPSPHSPQSASPRSRRMDARPGSVASLRAIERRLEG
jgi:excisionase family DNA binding protein